MHSKNKRSSNNDTSNKTNSADFWITWRVQLVEQTQQRSSHSPKGRSTKTWGERSVTCNDPGTADQFTVEYIRLKCTFYSVFTFYPLQHTVWVCTENIIWITATLFTCCTTVKCCSTCLFSCVYILILTEYTEGLNDWNESTVFLLLGPTVHSKNNVFIPCIIVYLCLYLFKDRKCKLCNIQALVVCM